MSDSILNYTIHINNNIEIIVLYNGKRIYEAFFDKNPDIKNLFPTKDAVSAERMRIFKMKDPLDMATITVTIEGMVSKINGEIV